MNILSSLITKKLKNRQKVLSQKRSRLTFSQNRLLVASFCGMSLFGYSQLSHALNITTSIPPLAGMIAPLLSEDDSLTVILKPGASPHGFQLKPSNLKTLQESDLILWVGSPVDNWMKKPLSNLDVKTLSIQTLPDVKQLPVRQGGLWERKGHSHSHDEHEGHDEHDGHEKHEEHNEVKETRMYGHLGVSLQNAQSLIKLVSEQLQLLKPKQAENIQQKTEYESTGMGLKNIQKRYSYIK